MRSKCMYGFEQEFDRVFSSRTSICRSAERGGLDKTLQNLQQGAPLSTLYKDQMHEIQHSMPGLHLDKSAAGLDSASFIKYKVI